MNPTLAPKQARSAAHLFAPIARDLDEVERILRQTLDSSRPGVDRLIAHLAHYRGKRLRPALLLLTARACGQVGPAHHLLGAVVEMIHTATLVHDDVLDSAKVRRHAPTVNAQWGNQASILLGDYLFTHAFHLSSTLDDVRACRLIGDATNRVCAGELHQVTQRGNLNLTEAEYLSIIDGKTAELTSVCCRLGALYCGRGAGVRATAGGGICSAGAGRTGVPVAVGVSRRPGSADRARRSSQCLRWGRATRQYFFAAAFQSRKRQRRLPTTVADASGSDP